MPAVLSDTASAQSSVVDLLFAQQPEQRGERRHGAVAQERDPLSSADADVDAAEGVIAGELALERDSHAFARQSRLADGRTQSADARSSFNAALQEASDARAKRAAANSAQQPQPAKSPTKLTSDANTSAEQKAGDSKTKTPAKSASHESQPKQQPSSQTNESNAPRSQPQTALRVNPQAAAQTVQAPQATSLTAISAANAASAVSAVSGASATSGSNPAGKSGPPAIAATRPASAATAANEGAKTKPAVAKPTNDAAPFERLLRFMKLQTNKENASATLRLDPPELGRIRVEMDVKADEVRLKIDSQNEMAHRMLSENADTLRRALEASGVRVAELEIRPTPEEPFPSADEGDDAQTETRPQQESRGEAEDHPSGGDSGSTRHGGVDSSQAEVADVAAQLRAWQETLIDVQA